MQVGRWRSGRGWLWQSSPPHGPMLLGFWPRLSRDGPRQFLAGFRGIFETDGYAAYEQLGGPEIVLAACWAHVRRKFYEAAKVAPREVLPARIVAGMDELFAMDAEARAQGFDPAGRHALRQQRAPGVLTDLCRGIEQSRHEALPASALERAVTYALAQWPKLVRFLEYPELELSNNWAENAFRPVALGRNNWLHLGSPQSRGEDRGHPLGGRDLPAVANRPARALAERPAGPGRHQHWAAARAHTDHLACAPRPTGTQLVPPAHYVVGLTPTIFQRFNPEWRIRALRFFHRRLKIASSAARLRFSVFCGFRRAAERAQIPSEPSADRMVSERRLASRRINRDAKPQRWPGGLRWRQSSFRRPRCPACKH